ncbi:MAG: histidine phosphatase family protein [Pseudonocardia sp.]|nr:histidine phosphatase family protein [Pseudonocardia sp.]
MVTASSTTVNDQTAAGSAAYPVPVSARLTLVAHGSTRATTAAAFGDDEPLDERGLATVIRARARLGRVSSAVSSPALACRQTASALGLDAVVDPMLADWDLGRWRGRTLDQVAAEEPAAIRAWLGAETAAPHGGEPLAGLLARAADWLCTIPERGHTVAVTHPAIVRAVVVATMSAPAAGFWRIDISPLTATVLRGGPERWTVRSTGLPLDQEI